jgi:lambda family phage portal protein
MGLGSKIITTWSRMLRAVGPDTRKRRFVEAQLGDTRLDISAASRQAVSSLARWLCYNDPTIRGALDTITRNTIGAGIKAQSRTSDEGWNNDAEAWFDMWSGTCDVRGILDWNTMQQVATRTMLRDNEIFALLTDNGDGWPMIQLVEGHRCETPGYLSSDTNVFDGVRLNKNGRPLSYYIRTGNDGEKFTEVQANDLILLAERDRADEVRSISKLASCINTCLDRSEILETEMLALKRAGQIGLALESSSNSGPGFFNPTSTDDFNLTTDKIFGGGVLLNVPIGKVLREIKNDRPSQNLQTHMDQYLKAIAQTLGLPYAMMWDPSTLSGPNTRLILGQAQRRFDEVAQTVIVQFISRVRKWALAKAIKRGDLTPPKGVMQWWAAEYHTPAKATIDAGRDSAADREDLKMGLTTMAQVYAARGEDYQAAINQRISESVYIQTQCAAAGIDTTAIQILNNAPVVAPAVNAPSAPATQETTVTPALEAREVVVHLTMAEPEPAPIPQPVTDPAPAPSTDTYTMRDDADFTLTKAEQEMIVSALGIGKYRPKSKKKK